MKIGTLFKVIITCWSILTTFQKIILGFGFLAAISYLTNYWSFLIVMVLSIPLAVKGSDRLLQKKVPFSSDVVLITVQYIKIILKSLQSLIYKQDSNNLLNVETTNRKCDTSVDALSVTNAEKILVDLVVRDFVESWFASFSKSPQFLDESRNVFYMVASDYHSRFSTIQPESVCLSFITLYQQHLQRFQKSKVLYESQKRKHLTVVSKDESKALPPSLEDAFGSNYPYHPALSSVNSEDKYLKGLSKATLALMIPDDVQMCESSQIIFAEILTNKIFKNVITLMSNPHWLYKQMIQLFCPPSVNTSNDNDKDVHVVGIAENDTDNKTCPDKKAHFCRNISYDDVSSVSSVSNATCFSSSDDVMSKNSKDSSTVLSSSIETADEVDDIPRVMFTLSESESSCSAVCDTVQSDVVLSRLEPGAQDILLSLCRSSQFDPYFIPDAKISDVHVSHTDAENVKENISNSLKPTFQTDKENGENISKQLITTFQSVKENINESISKQLKNTFQSLTKSDSSCENISPKRSVSSNDVPNFNLCDINEIAVPREENGAMVTSTVNDKTAVECPDEALPVKGNEIIRLSATEENTSPEGSAMNIADPIKAKSVVKTAELLSVKDESHIFQDIDVVKAEEFQEFRSNSKYTMYIIEYVALYFSERGHPVLKSGLVKRRFREFVNLQARLDDESKYKNLLKDVKGPSRWATLPFKNRDKESVESRRSFLDKFLKGLIAVEAVCNGPELREFLAYEGDGHIAYVRKAPEMSVPRIDKMFVRTVSEVFDRLKAIPDIPHNVISTITKRDRSVERDEVKKRDDEQLEIDFTDANSQQVTPGRIGKHWKLLKHTLSFLIHTRRKSNASRGHKIEEAEFLQDLEEFNSKVEMDNLSESISMSAKSSSSKQLSCRSLSSQLLRLQGDGSEVPEKPTDEVCGCDFSDIPLANAVFALTVQALQGREHWFCRERVVKTVSILIGRALDRWMRDQIQWLLSEQQLIYYLTLLRESIWPNGHLSTSHSPPVSDEDKRRTRNQAKQSLKKFLPSFIPALLGETDYDYAVEQIIASFECEKLNRHLLYTFLDILVEKIFPELSIQEIQMSLLS